MIFQWKCDRYVRNSCLRFEQRFWSSTDSLWPIVQISADVQLRKYKKDPYIRQIFQSNTFVRLFPRFVKIVIPFVNLKFAAVFQANPTGISCKNTFTFSIQFTNLTIHGNKHSYPVSEKSLVRFREGNLRCLHTFQHSKHCF